MVTLGSGANCEVDDYILTRYACYLIVENGDPRKGQIAFAQSYFAVQTRKQELIEEKTCKVRRIFLCLWKIVYRIFAQHFGKYLCAYTGLLSGIEIFSGYPVSDK